MSNNPDDKATADAAAVLKGILAKNNCVLSANQLSYAAFSTIAKWISSRAYHWAVHRGKAGFGQPDAYTVGFAEASLAQIADMGMASGLPMDQPIGKWSRNDAARLFAIAHEAVEATRMHTLESVGNPDEIPA